MKRGLLIGLLAALLLGCVPARTENALEASIVLSAYAGEAETVAIPEEIQGLPAVAIGDGCFARVGSDSASATEAETVKLSGMALDLRPEATTPERYVRMELTAFE